MNARHIESQEIRVKRKVVTREGPLRKRLIDEKMPLWLAHHSVPGRAVADIDFSPRRVASRFEPLVRLVQ